MGSDGLEGHMLNKQVQRLYHNGTWWVYMGRGDQAGQIGGHLACTHSRGSYVALREQASTSGHYSVLSPSQGVEESSLQLRTPDQTLRGLLMKQTLLQTPVPQSWAEQQL